MSESRITHMGSGKHGVMCKTEIPYDEFATTHPCLVTCKACQDRVMNAWDALYRLVWSAEQFAENLRRTKDIVP